MNTYQKTLAKSLGVKALIDNVFTYNAWKALGRQVNKGEHGVKVVTWIDATDKITGLPTKLCRASTVFHISQTSPIQ